MFAMLAQCEYDFAKSVKKQQAIAAELKKEEERSKEIALETERARKEFNELEKVLKREREKANVILQQEREKQAIINKIKKLPPHNNKPLDNEPWDKLFCKMEVSSIFIVLNVSRQLFRSHTVLLVTI